MRSQRSEPEQDLSAAAIREVVRTHRVRRTWLPFLRPAAVLVALFAHPSTNRTHVWLLRRPDDGSPHGGQVALPGGKRDRADIDLSATALREANEEIGLDPREVDLFGPIDEYVTITRFRVRPFVGWVSSCFEPRRHAPEADRVFHGPLATFLGPHGFKRVRVGPFHRSMPAYEVDGETVWGATFTILHRFGAMLKAR